MYIHIYIQTRIYICIHTGDLGLSSRARDSLCISMYKYTYTYIFIYACVCIYAYKHVFTYVYTQEIWICHHGREIAYIYIHICISMYTYIHIYVNLYIRVYTHKHAFAYVYTQEIWVCHHGHEIATHQWCIRVQRHLEATATHRRNTSVLGARADSSG